MKMSSRLYSIPFGIVALIFFITGFWPPSAARTDGSRNQPREAKMQLSGEKARDYLAQTSDGQSLMQALTAARFGLTWQEHGPVKGETVGGYLGMSHEQNLNAWFDQEGVTIRPTLPEAERDQAWSTVLQLKACGYGKQLVDVPPVVSRQVKDNRIEYKRSSNLQSAIKNQQFVEWYENRAEGIEQGFTLNERPERNDGVAPDEPLRVSLAVTGDLRARTKDEGTIELAKADGSGALSYSKLIAQDADGRQLSARMEARADGREIALVVEDAGARYPIVIDPIIASLEKKLDAGSGRETDARFGFAVAIDGDTAVVGAWREDFGSFVDAGDVYIFTRSGSTWAFSSKGNAVNSTNGGCGWSVAISGARVAYGCPGVNNNTGRAVLQDVSNNNFKELIPPEGTRDAGDRFGASVAISGSNIVVGAPFRGSADTGAAFLFTVDSNFSVAGAGFVFGSNNNDQLGTSVGADSDTFIAGAPGVGAGRAYVFDDRGNYPIILQPTDGDADDQFGQSVAISGNTAVVGAPFNRGTGDNAGAAYVFVRATNGNWSQQQRLLGSDAYTDSDFFGAEKSVAIQGNTIVVGAYGWEPTNNINDENGKAYIFMRSGTVWTQQATMVGDNHSPDQFGIATSISGDTVLIGANVATASGIGRAGAAYVYRLDCVPPISVEFNPTNETVCLGGFVQLIPSQTFASGHRPTSYQWRKNGVNIGAPSDILPYTINAATAADAGSYDVIASTACGSVTSNTLTLTVHTFSLNPTSQNFGVSGSTGIVNVTATGASCGWTAVSNSSFITVNSGSSGTGNGTVGFTVAANPNSAQRTGSITIAGITFNVSQDGTNCSYSIAPTSKTVGANASTNTVNVTAGAGCAWTATSNDPSFLSINSGASGSGNGTVTYTIAANFNTAQRTGTLTIAGQTFTVIQAGASVLGNISTRLRVETGDNVLFGGFIVTGTQQKKIIVRAIGPSLSFPDKLADPILELHDASGALLETNDNWVDSPNKQAIIDSTIPPSNDLESAIVRSVTPGNYTAIVRGVNGGTGLGVVEAYDLDTSADSKLANISTRGFVQTGDNVLFAGMIVVGQSSQKVIIRALGPSTGVPGALADPTLELHDGNGALLEANDNWVDSPNKQAIIDSTIPPPNPAESAIVRILTPANYTAIVRGVNNSTGIAVVEVYALN